MLKSVYKYIFFIILALFLSGLTELFSLRFQKGDVYPAYSSLRSDPLGSKVLYMSLGNFKEFFVKRNYQSFEKLQGRPGSVLLYLGAGRQDLDLKNKAFFQSLDQYVIQGGRLVISFLPSQQLSQPVKPEPAKKEIKPIPPSPEQEEKDRLLDSMEKHWAISLAYQDSLPKKEGELVAKRSQENKRSLTLIEGQLPPKLLWHSSLYFKYAKGPWKALYSVNDKPVIIEKALGRGSILLMSDSFIFSNEALLKDRQLSLLGALFQGREEIIFDEYHLGVVSQHGLIDLIVQYRLHFFFLTLFGVFMLLVWKNSSLAYQDLQAEPTLLLVESKKDYFEGLVSLFRKNIPPKNILSVCVDEWYKARGIKTGQEAKAYIDEIVISEKNDPVRGYQLIYKKLKERIRYE